jgi:putative transposase
MASLQHYHTRFEPEGFYHIYNRTVDGKPLFTQKKNYEYFLSRMEKYLTDFLDVYAWCLMNNHFHLMVRIKDLSTFKKLINLAPLAIVSDLPDVHKITAHAFQKMFQSYAMSFNKQENRTGTLFQTPFKRALIDSERYYSQLIYYIHANPQAHGFIEDFREYRWSSYGRILTPKPTRLMKNEVLNWFGGKQEYISFHSSEREVHYGIIIEDK